PSGVSPALDPLPGAGGGGPLYRRASALPGKDERMTPRRPFDIAVIVVCLFMAAATMALDASSPVAMALQRGDRITGLLIGSDYEDYTRHSDTMMFVSYDPTSRFLDVMSIPRDTMISMPDLPYVHRVNEVFAYEWRHSGHSFDM